MVEKTEGGTRIRKSQVLVQSPARVAAPSGAMVKEGLTTPGGQLMEVKQVEKEPREGDSGGADGEPGRHPSSRGPRRR